MNFQTVIGLEVHVELATRSKIFCACTTAFGGEPNTHCCPVCMGMPGTLPSLNKKAVEYAVKAAIALNCDISRYSRFDRKNYFYPDLPKAYQISQSYIPFAKNGWVDLTADGKQKTIRIHEIHMEEDAGKLIHKDDTNQTFVDYNRCGVPLIEIVTEPDFSNSREVIRFLEKIKSVFEYLGVSDCKMQEGSMRADINLSVRCQGEPLGVRTETKNLNSFKTIERVIDYESKRQTDILKKGCKVMQQTMRFDEKTGKTVPMRSKEDANDYRYFPEPDLPPVYIADEMIERLKNAQPEFAEQRAQRYVERYGFSQSDARLLAQSPNIADLFDDTVALCENPQEVKNWILMQLMYDMNQHHISPQQLKLSAQKLAQLIQMVLSEKINRQTAKEILGELVCDSDLEVDSYIARHQLVQIDDRAVIAQTVKQVIADNPKAADQYKNGSAKVEGFFVGQIMKALNGKARPDTVHKILKDELSKL